MRLQSCSQQWMLSYFWPHRDDRRSCSPSISGRSLTAWSQSWSHWLCKRFIDFCNLPELHRSRRKKGYLEPSPPGLSLCVVWHIGGGCGVPCHPHRRICMQHMASCSEEWSKILRPVLSQLLVYMSVDVSGPRLSRASIPTVSSHVL